MSCHTSYGSCLRNRDDDPLLLAFNWSLAFSMVGKDTSRLHNILSTNIIPFDLGMISLLEDEDGLPIAKLSVLSLNCAVELAVGRVLLEHVDLVVEVSERVIVGNNIYFTRV